MTAGPRLLVVLALMVMSVVASGGRPPSVRAATADRPRIDVNRSIGGIRIGERKAEVYYYYGTACAAGCTAKPNGCLAMVSDGSGCPIPVYDYHVAHGLLDVAYDKKHAVYVETTSPRYRTKAGIGVGSRIPFGRRFGVFKWYACNPGGFWLAGSGHGGHFSPRRIWTQLVVNRGRVRYVVIWRGDVAYNPC